MTPEEERPDRLVVRKVIPVPREEVFAAWIDPESVRHWMCPGDILTAEAQLDPRVGGTYRIVMKSRTSAFDHRGEYLVVDPPSKLVFTWVSAETDNQPTIVTVELFARREPVRAGAHPRTLPGGRRGATSPGRVGPDRRQAGRALSVEGRIARVRRAALRPGRARCGRRARTA